MKCPKCGHASQVVETRQGLNWTTKRKRECKLGHTYTTVEVYSEVFCSAKERAKVFNVTTTTRINFRKRDIEIFDTLAKVGWRAICEKFGITKTAVYLANKRGRTYAREERK
jgi:transcriptional regulator NrdR family protein